MSTEHQACEAPSVVMQVGGYGQAGGWRQFTDPIAVLTADRIPEVVGVLQEVERYASEGRWCVGYVAYEAAPAFDPALRTRSPRPGMPLAWFSVHESARPVADMPRSSSEHAGAHPNDDQRPKPVHVGPWRLPERDEYRRAIDSIGRQIAAGNTYQVNFTAQLTAPFTGTALQMFSELVRKQPTEFGAYLNVREHAVASVSPELFFERIGSRVTMRPMKGTIARGTNKHLDETNQHWLLSSAKNRAENTMIVDLLRNDLGRIARPGSVQVDDLIRLETYPTFHALTSTISADTQDRDLSAIFGALFPCGSITGAPKPSTMRIIAETETEPRGVYCGAIGFVAPGGDARFSVAIRTAVLGPDSVLRYGVGGGITTDSTADEEYAELLTKARVVLTLPGPKLLETFRLEDGVLRNIDRHLARMRASAAALGCPFEEPRALAALEELRTKQPVGSWRARLILDRAGEFHAEAAPFDPGAVRSMTARVGSAPVDSTDVRLRHKLSDRSLYDARRDTSVDTTLLVNERGEVTEFLFGNLVVRHDGDFYTPPLSSGLLPGVGRALAIEGGVKVRAIHRDDLADCQELWHVNSLRGWTRVNLVP